MSRIGLRSHLLRCRERGGYTLYCNAGPDVPNETVTDNRVARTFFSRGGRWGPTTGCQMADVFTRNVWDDTGAPLSKNEQDASDRRRDLQGSQEYRYGDSKPVAERAVEPEMALQREMATAETG